MQIKFQKNFDCNFLYRSSFSFAKVTLEKHVPSKACLCSWIKFFKARRIIMKKLLVVLMMTICSMCFAEWDFTWVNPSNGDIYYHDKSTIQKDGQFRKMWTLQQYKTPADIGLGPVELVKSQFSFDCKNSLIKQLAIVVYKLNGDVQLSKVFDNKDWEPVIPGTPMMDDWKTACGKK